MSEVRNGGGEAGEVREAPASEVKQAWHEYMDRVSRGPQEIEERPSSDSLFGCLAGTVTTHGDVVGPLAETWAWT